MILKFTKPETEENLLTVRGDCFPVTCNIPGPFTMEVLLEEGEDKPTPDNILFLFEKYISWAHSTFLNSTMDSRIKKLDHEVVEFMKSIENIYTDKEILEEAADVLMCLLFCLNRKNISPLQFMVAFAEKLEINKNRKWRQQPDGTYSHFTPELPF